MIRTKDKIFLLVVVPLSVALAYFWHIRPRQAASLAALEKRDRATVTHEEYPGGKRARSAALEAAESALAAERAVVPPPREIVADSSASPARRTQDVVAALRCAGLRIVSVSLAREDVKSRAAIALRAAGARPSPVKRVYRLEGSFKSLKNALDSFVREKAAVIVSGVESEGADRWKVEIHE